MFINILDSEGKSNIIEWSDLVFGLDLNLNYLLRDKMLSSGSCPWLKLSLKVYELLVLLVFWTDFLLYMEPNILYCRQLQKCYFE